VIVPSSRPRWSNAAATWASAWVSIPSVTNSCVSRMVDIAVSLVFGGSVDGDHQGPQPCGRRYTPRGPWSRRCHRRTFGHAAPLGRCQVVPEAELIIRAERRSSPKSLTDQVLNAITSLGSTYRPMGRGGAGPHVVV
jgi:hypothetical protein